MLRYTQHDKCTISFRYILPKEVKDPLAAIVALIAGYSKTEWEEILYEWLSYGLSANALAGSRYGSHSTRIYQILIKIVELSYILAFEDEIEFVNEIKTIDYEN